MEVKGTSTVHFLILTFMQEITMIKYFKYFNV